MRTALVTGGSRGLGRAIAFRLASDGVAVAVNYVSDGVAAQSAVQEISDSGGRAIAVQGDVANPEQVNRMVPEAADRLGGLDILVNNAGILLRGDLENFQQSDYDRMRRVNVDGLVAVTRAALPYLKRSPAGRVVNISSVAAHGTTMSGTTFYAATKAEVLLLTKRFALELGRYGITVNAIAPGFFVTDLVTQDQNITRMKLTIPEEMLQKLFMPKSAARAAARAAR
jgi:3-oxoacyl-[acyl-carrier protein] reductase